MNNKLQLAVENHEHQMQKCMDQVHSIAWDFSLRNIMKEVKISLLADENVHEEVKRYLIDRSQTQFDFYYKNQIDSDMTHYSCIEGRTCLRDYELIRLKAQEPLVRAGFSVAQISLYEIISRLTHESYRVNLWQSVESILMGNRKYQYLQVLCALCHKYENTAAVDFLVAVEQYIAAYQKHDDARKVVLAEQHQLLAKEKNWWEKLVAGEV